MSQINAYIFQVVQVALKVGLVKAAAPVAATAVVSAQNMKCSPFIYKTVGFSQIIGTTVVAAML